jgi:hypothetical protein
VEMSYFVGSSSFIFHNFQSFFPKFALSSVLTEIKLLEGFRFETNTLTILVTDFEEIYKISNILLELIKTRFKDCFDETNQSFRH